jgi:hypothetical protein
MEWAVETCRNWKAASVIELQEACRYIPGAVLLLIRRMEPVVRLHPVCGPTCCRTCAENCAYGNITTPCNHTAGGAGCLRDGRMYGACEHYRKRPNKGITGG